MYSSWLNREGQFACRAGAHCGMGHQRNAVPFCLFFFTKRNHSKGPSHPSAQGGGGGGSPGGGLPCAGGPGGTPPGGHPRFGSPLRRTLWETPPLQPKKYAPSKVTFAPVQNGGSEGAKGLRRPGGVSQGVPPKTRPLPKGLPRGLTPQNRDSEGLWWGVLGRGALEKASC